MWLLCWEAGIRPSSFFFFYSDSTPQCSQNIKSAIHLDFGLAYKLNKIAQNEKKKNFCGQGHLYGSEWLNALTVAGQLIDVCSVSLPCWTKCTPAVTIQIWAANQSCQFGLKVEWQAEVWIALSQSNDKTLGKKKEVEERKKNTSTQNKQTSTNQTLFPQQLVLVYFYYKTSKLTNKWFQLIHYNFKLRRFKMLIWPMFNFRW